MKINVTKMTRLISANFPRNDQAVIENKFVIAQSQDYTVELRVINNSASKAAGDEVPRIAKRDECITELQRWTAPVPYAKSLR